MRSSGFHYEFGRDNVIYTTTPPVQIEDPDRDTPFYKLYYSGKGKKINNFGNVTWRNDVSEFGS